MNMSILVMRLEGQKQSWGEQCKWSYRDSAALPTKSGVIGLISCALGLERGDPEILALHKQLKMGVRADRKGMPQVDFQTAFAEQQYLANRKTAPNATVVQYKTYLDDACFTVFLEGERPLLDRIAAALEEPKWPYYLGRKCCIPSTPVFREIKDDYFDLELAIRAYPLAKRHDRKMMYESERQDPSSIYMLRLDEPREGYRKFKHRRVYRGVMEATF